MNQRALYTTVLTPPSPLHHCQNTPRGAESSRSTYAASQSARVVGADDQSEDAVVTRGRKDIQRTACDVEIRHHLFSRRGSQPAHLLRATPPTVATFYSSPLCKDSPLPSRDKIERRVAHNVILPPRSLQGHISARFPHPSGGEGEVNSNRGARRVSMLTVGMPAQLTCMHSTVGQQKDHSHFQGRESHAHEQGREREGMGPD